MRNNLIRFAKLFLYTLFIGFVLYGGTVIQNKLRIRMVTTFSPHLYHFYVVLLPIIIGILIALPSFLSLLKKKGTWKFDWIKFISIGLPTFYFTIFPYIYFSPLGPYIPNFFNIIFLTVGSTLMLHTVSGVVFGYLILSSFSKETEQSTTQIEYYM